MSTELPSPREFAELLGFTKAEIDEVIGEDDENLPDKYKKDDE